MRRLDFTTIFSKLANFCLPQIQQSVSPFWGDIELLPSTTPLGFGTLESYVKYVVRIPGNSPHFTSHE